MASQQAGQGASRYGYCSEWLDKNKRCPAPWELETIALAAGLHENEVGAWIRVNGVQRYPEEYKQSYSHGVVYMDLSFEQREAIRNIIVWRELRENGQSTIHAVEPQADVLDLEGSVAAVRYYEREIGIWDPEDERLLRPNTWSPPPQTAGPSRQAHKNESSVETSQANVKDLQDQLTAKINDLMEKYPNASGHSQTAAPNKTIAQETLKEVGRSKGQPRRKGKRRGKGEDVVTPQTQSGIATAAKANRRAAPSAGHLSCQANDAEECTRAYAKKIRERFAKNKPDIYRTYLIELCGYQRDLKSRPFVEMKLLDLFKDETDLICGLSCHLQHLADRVIANKQSSTSASPRDFETAALRAPQSGWGGCFAMEETVNPIYEVMEPLSKEILTHSIQQPTLTPPIIAEWAKKLGLPVQDMLDTFDHLRRVPDAVNPKVFRAHDVVRGWFNSRLIWPYTTESEFKEIARQADLTEQQTDDFLGQTLRRQLRPDIRAAALRVTQVENYDVLIFVIHRYVLHTMTSLKKLQEVARSLDPQCGDVSELFAEIHEVVYGCHTEECRDCILRRHKDGIYLKPVHQSIMASAAPLRPLTTADIRPIDEAGPSATALASRASLRKAKKQGAASSSQCQGLQAKKRAALDKAVDEALAEAADKRHRSLVRKIGILSANMTTIKTKCGSQYTNASQDFRTAKDWEKALSGLQARYMEDEKVMQEDFGAMATMLAQAKAFLTLEEPQLSTEPSVAEEWTGNDTDGVIDTYVDMWTDLRGYSSDDTISTNSNGTNHDRISQLPLLDLLSAQAIQPFTNWTPVCTMVMLFYESFAVAAIQQGDVPHFRVGRKAVERAKEIGNVELNADSRKRIKQIISKFQGYVRNDFGVRTLVLAWLSGTITKQQRKKLQACIGQATYEVLRKPLKAPKLQPSTAPHTNPYCDHCTFLLVIYAAMSAYPHKTPSEQNKNDTFLLAGPGISHEDKSMLWDMAQIMTETEALHKWIPDLAPWLRGCITEKGHARLHYDLHWRIKAMKRIFNPSRGDAFTLITQSFKEAQRFFIQGYMPEIFPGDEPWKPERIQSELEALDLGVPINEQPTSLLWKLDEVAQTWPGCLESIAEVRRICRKGPPCDEETLDKVVEVIWAEVTGTRSERRMFPHFWKKYPGRFNEIWMEVVNRVYHDPKLPEAKRRDLLLRGMTGGVQPGHNEDLDELAGNVLFVEMAQLVYVMRCLQTPFRTAYDVFAEDPYEASQVPAWHPHITFSTTPDGKPLTSSIKPDIAETKPKRQALETVKEEQAAPQASPSTRSTGNKSKKKQKKKKHASDTQQQEGHHLETDHPGKTKAEMLKEVLAIGEHATSSHNPAINEPVVNAKGEATQNPVERDPILEPPPSECPYFATTNGYGSIQGGCIQCYSMRVTREISIAKYAAESESTNNSPTVMEHVADLTRKDAALRHWDQELREKQPSLGCHLCHFSASKGWCNGRKGCLGCYLQRATLTRHVERWLLGDKGFCMCEAERADGKCVALGEREGKMRMGMGMRMGGLEDLD